MFLSLMLISPRCTLAFSYAFAYAFAYFTGAKQTLQINFHQIQLMLLGVYEGEIKTKINWIERKHTGYRNEIG